MHWFFVVIDSVCTSEQSDLEYPVSFIFSSEGLSFIWPSLSLQLRLVKTRVSACTRAHRAQISFYKPMHVLEDVDYKFMYKAVQCS